MDDKAQKIFDYVSSNLDNGSSVTIVVGNAKYAAQISEAVKGWPNSPQVKVVYSQELEPDMLYAFVDDDSWGVRQQSLEDLLIPRPGYKVYTN